LPSGRLVRLLASTTASVVIETAVSLSIFLMVVFGVFELSIVLLTYCNVTTACSQTTRYASIHSDSSLSPDTTTQLQSMFTSKLFLVGNPTPTFTVTYLTQNLQAGTNTVGGLVQITASWKQTVALPFISHNTVSISVQDVRPITR
jgi:Flp pilus assembly protein TadG